MDGEIDLSKNIEINKALKEFEEKEKEAAPSYQAVKFYKESTTPKIVELTMKWVGTKEQKNAEWVLFGFVILMIGISIFLFFWGGLSQPKLSPAQIEAVKQEMIRMEQKR